MKGSTNSMAKNLISEMKEAIKNSGASKREIVYFAPDSVHRLRFLTELDAGISIQMHNSYQENIFEICHDPEDHEDCDGCKNEVPIVEYYAWSVWDYDSNSVGIVFTKATGVSPVPSFIEMYEEFGTIMDRDYKVKKVGKSTTGSFVITPLDKSKFTNKKAKPFKEEKIIDIITKAYGSSKKDDDSDDDDEEEKPVKKSSKKSGKKKAAKSLKEKYEELDMRTLKDIAIDLGMTKKEVREFDDEEDLVNELFDNYEENDLEDLYTDFVESDDEDED